MRRHFLLWAALLVAPTSGLADCPRSGETPARIAAVESRLELRLADGRVARLVGLDPPQGTPDDPELAETARSRLAALVADKALTLQLLSATSDRWGRWPALAFGSDDEAGGFTTRAIAAGLGRYLSEPAALACREAFVVAEAKARQAKLGLWSDPYYAVLAVDDRAAFMERSGTIVVAEGQLTAVQPSPYRTTLRFAAPDRSGAGSHGGRMLVATIVPRVMKSFAARHVDVAALVGRRLRVRGLLDLRFGPRIELAGPDAVELLAPEPVAPAPPN